ncbi:hypothetical protein [Shewanella gelidii]|uniref:Uncharacterized protein n=1 Tax=Shewanella gelidii TaxID=1642821 RepID=A0A917JQH1_9GAMM|nr:hypothetical protein [Shewanella gelidii]MCL1097627.1 hypothetical protein [Shewanella gelidii]GGI80122.1 hypothetical protein GCM10009332_16800 [Shewanella gelidii]
MYNTAKKQVWYGELRTSRGNTVVIYDKQFPDATPGRVYFYNTQRDSIIEYAEDIVQANLHDLNSSETKAAEEEFGAAWEACRAEFMSQHQAWVDANQAKATPAKKTKPEPEPVIEPEPESESLEDDYDDWSNEIDD